MKIFPLNRIWTLVLILSSLLLAYGIFEFFLSSGSASESTLRRARIEAVSEAVNNFNNRLTRFSRQSQELGVQIRNAVGEKAPQSTIFEQINDRNSLWGASLFKENELTIWSGFTEKAVPVYPNGLPARQVLSVQRDKNVVYLRSHFPFYVESPDSLIRYDLLTTLRLEQVNILPIGDTYEYELEDLLQLDSDYQVHINFFEAAPPQADARSAIRVQTGDSIGVAYTLPDDLQAYNKLKELQDDQIRLGFYLLIFGGLSIVLLYLNRFSQKEIAFWIQFITFAASWLFFGIIEMSIRWNELIPGYEDLDSFVPFGIHCVLSLLLIYSFNKKELYTHNSVRNFGIYYLIGIMSMIFVLFFLSTRIIQLFEEADVLFLDLNLLPGNLTLLLYFIASFTLVCTVYFGYRLSYLLFRLFPKNTLLCWLGQLSLIAGICLILTMIPVFSDLPELILYMLLSILLLTLFAAWLRSRYHEWFLEASRIRWMVISSILLSFVIHSIAFQGYTERRDEVLLQSARNFQNEQESQAEDIVSNLLIELEAGLSGMLSGQQEDPIRTLSSDFGEFTRDLIDPAWENYSISAQLVNNQGAIISEYTSTLDSPNWTRAFDIQSLEIPFEVERIRVNNLRPIVRSTPISEAPSNYSEFRRGWIPLFERDEEPVRVGWILCSVYKEIPQYEKPLRAVFASDSETGRLNTINLNEFREDRSFRSTIVGTPLELPGYIRLPEYVKEEIADDSVYYRTANFDERRVRQLYLNNKEASVVLAATPSITFENHLFSMVRLFFFLFIVGLLYMIIISLIRRENLLDQSKRFRDRLLDRFLIASLFCLMALILTSNIAITDQNEKNVEDQLILKTRNLAEALSVRPAGVGDDPQEVLDQIASTLDSDASLYRGKFLSFSTAIQIYDQYLIPDLLPWQVYQRIYEEENQEVVRRARLGDDELLIGYTPWFDENRSIEGIVAIPIFLRAPAYNEQFLSITSYLFGIYVIIFGVFILVASFISSQLTAPLESLRGGLRRISSGEMDTTLPVDSKDEIGSLTKAYNVMSGRLKDVQKELIEAEREAAWKEMAQQVAHEIKNPLTPMKLNLQHLEQQMLKEDIDITELKPKVKRITENMIEQIDSLSQIASDFSKFARPVKPDFQPIDVHEVIGSVTDLYAQDDGIRIHTQFSAERSTISGGRDEVRRVLINIIKNAREAIREYGNITIRTRLNASNTSVIIEIEDDGDGIDPADEDSIFVPNFSTKSSGTGLGLAISKKITEEHRGSISFRSELDAGTTFEITLPLKT